MSNLKRTVSYLRRNGIKKTYHMVLQRLAENAVKEDYDKIRKNEMADGAMLEAQNAETAEAELKFSILIPACNTPEDYLRILLDSILVQSYENFEVIIADASSDEEVQTVVSEYDDERIVYIRLPRNGGISENTNEALDKASGDVICLIDHDDYIEPDALYHMYKAFDNGALMAYSDEDKTDSQGEKFFDVNRKPDFNYDMLLSNNYICHLLCIKKGLVLKAGGFRKEYDGAQDFDLILRCMDLIFDGDYEKPVAQNEIVHIKRVLYHWRTHLGSTASNPDSKRYAYEAGRLAILDHLKRREIKGSVAHTDHLGFYKCSYESSDLSDFFQEYIPEGIRQDKNNTDKITHMKQYFVRPEVKCVYGRSIKGGITAYGPYAGMKEWDSGIMHRAHMLQDIEETGKDLDNMVKISRVDGTGTLALYDPEIIFWQK